MFLTMCLTINMSAQTFQLTQPVVHTDNNFRAFTFKNIP